MMLWVVFVHLWCVVGADRLVFKEVFSPKWFAWLSHFEEEVFYDSYKIVWDHSEWCNSPFTCRGPRGEAVHHQMCVYTWEGSVGTECKNYIEVRVHESEYIRTRLLDTHNTYRDEVAVHGINKRFYGAANIRRMTWDYSLEDMAINLGLQCFKTSYKDGNLCRRIRGFDYAGLILERIAFDTNKTSTSEYIVEQWAESLARYSYQHPDIQELHQNFTHGPWDRATQMLWHSTYKVGCGVLTYSTKRENPLRDYKPTYYKWVGCYYAPPGNKIGQQIFKEGAPGLCPQFTTTRYSCYGADYPALCHYADDPLNKKIPPRSRPKDRPPIPLYSQFVLATITAPTGTYKDEPTDGQVTATGTAPARRRAIGDKELNAREGAGSQLLPGFAGVLPMFMLGTA